MFDKAAIEAMAKGAKEQLAKQKEEGEVPVDLYADMMNETDDESAAKSEGNFDEWNRSITTEPTEYPTYPKINFEPDEEDLYDNPVVNPFDRPIFPGGPLQSQIDSWKKQWQGYNLFVTEITGEYFVFRTLNRFEYKQIVALPNTDPLMREEIICETVTMWPENYDWKAMATRQAGVPSTYAQIIMEKSGFTKEYSIQVL